MILKKQVHCFYELGNSSVDEAVQRCSQDFSEKLIDVCRLLYMKEEFNTFHISVPFIMYIFNSLGRHVTYNSKAVEFELEMNPKLAMGYMDNLVRNVEENSKRNINSTPDYRFDCFGAVPKLDDGTKYNTISDREVIDFMKKEIPIVDCIDENANTPIKTRFEIMLDIFQYIVAFKVARIGNKQYYFYEVDESIGGGISADV